MFAAIVLARPPALRRSRVKLAVSMRSMTACPSSRIRTSTTSPGTGMKRSPVIRRSCAIRKPLSPSTETHAEFFPVETTSARPVCVTRKIGCRQTANDEASVAYRNLEHRGRSRRCASRGDRGRGPARRAVACIGARSAAARRSYALLEMPDRYDAAAIRAIAAGSRIRQTDHCLGSFPCAAGSLAAAIRSAWRAPAGLRESLRACPFRRRRRRVGSGLTRCRGRPSAHRRRVAHACRAGAPPSCSRRLPPIAGRAGSPRAVYARRRSCRSEFWRAAIVPSPLGYVGLSDVVDVIATSILIYYVLLLIRGTRAVQILTGILVLLGLLGIATLFHLYLLGTILRLLVVGAAVTIPIVFQPELRRALEQIGRGGLFRMERERGELGRGRPEDRTIATFGPHRVLARAQPSRRADRHRTAERPQGVLRKRNARCTPTFPKSSGVDLRVNLARCTTARSIVREGRIEAAGCFLPLSEQARSITPARYAPSRCSGSERADRRRRARRFGADGSDYDRARRAALATGRRRATFDKNAAGGDAAAASAAGHGLARASSVAPAHRGGARRHRGFRERIVDWRLSAKTSR